MKIESSYYPEFINGSLILNKAPKSTSVRQTAER